MQPTKQEILDLVNSFLEERKLPLVSCDDAIFSSGLVDSLGMFELMFFLETSGVKLNNSSYNFKNMGHSMNTVNNMYDDLKKVT